MARTLLFRTCSGSTATESYWDDEAHTEVRLSGPATTCTPYYLTDNTLLDTWCEGTTQVQARAYGQFEPTPPAQAYTLTYTQNAATCSRTSCGLRVDDVMIQPTGDTWTITILASGYAGAKEYSLNQFTSVQDSPVFENLAPGTYTAYVRAKN